MAVASVHVVRLVLQETGTYNIQYYRPYQINNSVQSSNKLHNRLESAMMQNGKVHPSMLAGLGEEIITPQATPQAAVAIPGGWENKRVRFVLEISITNQIGAQSVYFIQGYTNHFGISQSGFIDQSMLFVINSIFQLNRKLVQGVNGSTFYQDRILDCSHMLVAPEFLDPSSMTKLYTLQPSDLFSFLQISSQTTGFNVYDQYAEMAGQSVPNPLALDTRMMVNSFNFKPSQRLNNSPLDYLARTINFGVQSQSMNSTHDTYNPLYDSAISEARLLAHSSENKITDSDFMSLLNENNYQTAQTLSSVFTLAQLLKIDPNTANVTNYLQLSPEKRASLHQTGLTAHWTGSDKTTQVAVILANSIPTLMSQCLISQIHLRSTNLIQVGAMTTQIINAKSLSNTALVQMFEVFRNKLESEIIYDFTYGNQIGYTLDVRSDMFGETTISLSLDSEPEVVYVVPTFCDSLITPIANIDPARVSKEAMSANYLIDVAFSASNQSSQHTGLNLNQSI